MGRARLLGLGSVAAVAALVALPADVGADSSASVNAVVSIADQLAVRATNIATAEGASISGPIATFTDSNTAPPASAFTVTVGWGDGTASPGAVSGGSGSFTVTASHAYAEEGSYRISVLVEQGPAGSHAQGNGTAMIADAVLAATGRKLSGTKTIRAVVATFRDADPGGVTGDFTASISWGDGSSSSGSIAAQQTGFAVSGSHTYRKSGTFTITVSVRDAGGAYATATTKCAVRGS